MEMRPLICPQCGGEITNYSPVQTMVTCSYCSTRFLIDPDKQQAEEPAPFEYVPIDDTEPVEENKMVGMIVIGVLAFVAFGIGLSILPKKNSSTTTSSAPYTRTATPSPNKTALPTPNQNLLEFGSAGTENGEFTDASAIAVDKQGRIYVSDGTLRVQQFDDKGKYLKTFAVPATGKNYSNAAGIDKIAVATDNKLYVAVGGVILVYNENSQTPNRTIQLAPDYIQDMALKSDGSLLMISENDSREKLTFVNKTGGFTGSITAFHTNALKAHMSPQETAIEIIRMAVDGAGNIYSIYAFGDTGSLVLSYNTEEMMIARFKPDGKFVGKFAQTNTSCGIEIDSMGRIYITDNNTVQMFSNTGDKLNSFDVSDAITAFAIGPDNSVYLLTGGKVIKRPPLP